jgi:SAM-dependent methyltransferase
MVDTETRDRWDEEDRLAAIGKGWEQAAHDDALFNILTIPGKENGQWVEEEFFARGVNEIEDVLDRVSDLIGPKGKALDFGCGVGRLTQALAAYFEEAHGVDIAPEMIRQAEGFSNLENTFFHLNLTSDLSQFDTGQFDLVYTRIVLQHMPPVYQQGYVREFIRILNPVGLAIFDIPDGPEYHHENEWLSMYGVPQSTVERWVEDAGASVLRVIAEPASMWTSKRYVVR